MTAHLGLLLCLPFVAPSQLPGAWKALTSPAGGFTVQMPGEPREEKSGFTTSRGNVAVTTHRLEVKKGNTLAVSFSQGTSEGKAKDQDLEGRLDRAVAEVLASTKGKLVSEKKVKLDALPGRELLIEVEGKGIIRTRLFAQARRLYEVLVIGSREWAESADANRFLDSFALLK